LYSVGTKFHVVLRDAVRGIGRTHLPNCTKRRRYLVPVLTLKDSHSYKHAFVGKMVC